MLETNISLTVAEANLGRAASGGGFFRGASAFYLLRVSGRASTSDSSAIGRAGSGRRGLVAIEVSPPAGAGLRSVASASGWLAACMVLRGERRPSLRCEVFGGRSESGSGAVQRACSASLGDPSSRGVCGPTSAASLRLLLCPGSSALRREGELLVRSSRARGSASFGSGSCKRTGRRKKSDRERSLGGS
jgi:hypothetical protein